MTLNQLSFSPASGFRTVLDWIEAVNACNPDRLLALSHQDIERLGPRGSTHGHQVLADWLNQAGMQFVIQSLELNHSSENVTRLQPDAVEIYVRRQAIWTSPDGQSSQAECLSIFTLTQNSLNQPKIRAYERRMLK